MQKNNRNSETFLMTALHNINVQQKRVTSFLVTLSLITKEVD